MKSQWKVSSNFVGDGWSYNVFRIRDVDGIDHSGNREVVACFDTKEEAQRVADEMNQDEAEVNEV